MDVKNDILLQKILANLNKIENLLLLKEAPFLSFDQTVEYLRIPAGTLRTYCSKKLLPYYRINQRRVYFKVDDLNKFVCNELNRQKSEDEIREEAALLSAEL